MADTVPTGKYPPNPNCKFCAGSGKLKNGDACICTWVDHSVSNEAGDALRETLRQMLNEPETIREIARGAGKIADAWKAAHPDEKS